MEVDVAKKKSDLNNKDWDLKQLSTVAVLAYVVLLNSAVSAGMICTLAPSEHDFLQTFGHDRLAPASREVSYGYLRSLI